MKVKRSNPLTTVILILVFLAGLSLVLYPGVSSWLNSLRQSRIITSYEHSLSGLDARTCAQLWEDARAHNAHLAAGDADADAYETLLDPYGSGYMGYLEIPSIGARLPIAHGVEEETLTRAVGHLDWSSLPVGGESTHCVLSGHRGLPSAELLTNLDKLEPGDLFCLHILNEILEYQVDAVNVVEPDDTSLLQITEGEDHVTLLTCTPYGINSHRLLVRGTRISYENAAEQLVLSGEVEPVSPAILLLICMAVLTAAQMVLHWLHRPRSKRISPPKGPQERS